MAGYQRSHSANPTTRIPSPFQVAVAALKRMVSSHAKRKERAQVSALLTMDERQLLDMGITRDDVRTALATSDTPSAALQITATRRRNRMVI
ncbi:MAG: DUF1127 domain-containing protein [Pseudomonadota bacterium]